MAFRRKWRFRLWKEKLIIQTSNRRTTDICWQDDKRFPTKSCCFTYAIGFNSFFWYLLQTQNVKRLSLTFWKQWISTPLDCYHLPPLNPSWNEDNHDLWARYWYHDHGRWCWRSFLKKFSRFPSVVGDSMTLKERQSLDAFRTWYVYCPEWGYWHWLFSPSPKQHAEGLLFPMLFLCRCKGDGVLWKPSRMELWIYYRYHLGNWLL